ncbi:MAG: zeta toxin family protein [Propionibacteriaceae bacterium]|nr:zeta toxin family protein [Propionibacteriaceae bacterium]
MARPQLLVFAGPNGSGKTTATRGASVTGVYVNADDIKSESGCSDLEAAQIAERLRESLLRAGADFTFETVLSTSRNLDLIQRAKASGYEVTSVFVLTVNVSINVARVRGRVATGGHNVPEEKIRSRYERSLANLPALANLSDTIVVIDNTGDDPVQIYARDTSGFVLKPTLDWSEQQIRQLVGL